MRNETPAHSLAHNMKTYIIDHHFYTRDKPDNFVSKFIQQSYINYPADVYYTCIIICEKIISENTFSTKSKPTLSY